MFIVALPEEIRATTVLTLSGEGDVWISILRHYLEKLGIINALR